MIEGLPPGDDEARLAAIAARLERHHRVLFITGAGISAESGLPTYRGIGGLYEGRDTELGIPIEEALSGHMFAHRPDVTWRHIMSLEATIRSARFNRAHEILAAHDGGRRGWARTCGAPG